MKLTDLKERLDFGVESPPLPVPELEVGGTVPLQDADGVQLLHPLLVVPEDRAEMSICIEL
jgi:hypothetical protein